MNNSSDLQVSQWRCFIKGISVTHVILTFVPSTLNDLKSLVHSDTTNIPSLSGSKESFEGTSSRGSNYSDVPINVNSALTLPIYVYDCPLALLVSAYIANPEDAKLTKDIYEDHRFKNNELVQDEWLRYVFSCY